MTEEKKSNICSKCGQTYMDLLDKISSLGVNAFHICDEDLLPKEEFKLAPEWYSERMKTTETK